VAVGTNIKKYRELNCFTQKELGDKLSVSQQMIAQWERGERVPKIETIEKIAVALGTSVNQIYVKDSTNDGYLRSLSEEELLLLILGCMYHYDVTYSSRGDYTFDCFRKAINYIEKALGEICSDRRLSEWYKEEKEMQINLDTVQISKGLSYTEAIKHCLR
jgi:transcriptional regulator with XRE-family HTH domain